MCTGKTQIINGMLSSFDPAEYLSSTINFNFYTTSAVLQNTMGIPLVKKTGTSMSIFNLALYVQITVTHILRHIYTHADIYIMQLFH